MSRFFLKYRKIFFLTALLLISLTLYATRVEKKKEYSLFDRVVLTAFYPPLKVTSLFIVKTNLIWKKYLFLINLEDIHESKTKDLKRYLLTP